MGFSGTLNGPQSKHCPHKCIDVEVNGVYTALIKAVQVLPVNPNITACLSWLQPSFFSMVPIQVYDVPSQARRAPVFTVSSWKYTQQNASKVVISLALKWVLVWCLYCHCDVLFAGINNSKTCSTKTRTASNFRAGEKIGLSKEFKLWQSRRLLCKFQDIWRD